VVPPATDPKKTVFILKQIYVLATGSSWLFKASFQIKTQMFIYKVRLLQKKWLRRKMGTGRIKIYVDVIFHHHPYHLTVQLEVCSDCKR